MLWAVTTVEPAGWPRNREKNYEIAMAALVDEVKALASPAATVQ